MDPDSGSLIPIRLHFTTFPCGSRKRETLENIYMSGIFLTNWVNFNENQHIVDGKRFQSRLGFPLNCSRSLFCMPLTKRKKKRKERKERRKRALLLACTAGHMFLMVIVTVAKYSLAGQASFIPTYLLTVSSAQPI